MTLPDPIQEHYPTPMGLVLWDANPPAGTPWTVHQLSFHDAIERASTFLMTDYADQEEFLVVGAQARETVSVFPQFVPDPHALEHGRFQSTAFGPLLGRLAQRQVYFCPVMPPQVSLLVNTAGRHVEIHIAVSTTNTGTYASLFGGAPTT
jgi:hypothetical protein